MKLVIQNNDQTLVRSVKEYELNIVINHIKTTFTGYEIKPLIYEVFRYKLEKGVAIIYKDNKRLRTKNDWFEARALACLSKLNHNSFYHQIKLKRSDGHETEIDGLDIETRTIMVEIKRAVINQEWIDYYEKKRKLLKMRNCIVIASSFKDNLKIPSNIQCYIFKPEMDSLLNYYNKEFEIPKWIKPYIPSRHIRILLNNGRWIGLKRKLTNTAKHTLESKSLLFINSLARREKFPIKIYYSLSPMLMPVEEYFGKGRPLLRTLAVFDVDSESHQHIIGEEGYCLECLKSSKYKAAIVSEKLSELGEKFYKLYSGNKGFHFYLIDEKNGETIKEIPVQILEEFLILLKDEKEKNLVDNVNFRSKDGSYDLHRIFKLPHSVDNSTGLLVKERFEKLNFNDTLQEI